MFNVCSKCGLYHDDKIIEPEGPFAVCPSCGHKHRFKQLPLFIVTGASGAGKSTICLELSSVMPEIVVFEVDILWRDEFNKPDTDYREFRNLCLRVSKNIAQGGKPVVLCGSSIPSQYEQCVERRYFKNLHYLAVVCDDEIIRSRLKQRPGYRGCGSDEFIEGHIRFNNWFKENAHNTKSGITLLDNSRDSLGESVEKAASWIRGKIE
ncbi:MAG: AAA family ATPase [Bacillota bacterium]